MGQTDSMFSFSDKRILERLGIQTSSSFIKIGVLAFIWLGFLSGHYWNLLDHDLMANTISILAGNLNSGRSYLITAVAVLSCSPLVLTCKIERKEVGEKKI